MHCRPAAGEIPLANARSVVYLSIDRRGAVSGTAKRLMDLAEAHIRDAGYTGFSFRNLAADASTTIPGFGQRLDHSPSCSFQPSLSPPVRLLSVWKTR
jgi:hypothetical protein